MASEPIQTRTSTVVAEAGVVILECPAGANTTMSSEAAAETGKLLTEAAQRAAEQRDGTRPPIE